MSEFEMILEATEHQKEIESTRVGGFGGSDAKVFANIYKKGLFLLSKADTRRIAVAMGTVPADPHEDSVYTINGHRFEAEVAEYLGQFLSGVEKEKVLEKPYAKNFRTFAHADYYLDGTVYECKFYTKDTTEEAAKKVKEQLQWYYLMGAKEVILVHGTGTHEPYHVETINVQRIPRNESMVNELRAGVQKLDKAINQGYKPIIF